MNLLKYATAAVLLAIHCTLASGAAAAGWTSLDAVAFAPAVAATDRMVTSVETDPAGQWLYATTLDGRVLRWRIDAATGTLSGQQVFAPPAFQDKDGARSLIGLAFDPTDPLVLWVSDNYPTALWGSQDRRPDFSGRVSRIRIDPGDDAFTGNVETYLHGLPRSCVDHLSNSLRFRANPDAATGGPAWLLYLSQGSDSMSGAANKTWCYRPERLLNAAILEIDPTRTPPEGGFDVTTEPIPDDGHNRRFGYNFVVGPLMLSSDSDLKAGAIAINGGEFKGDQLFFREDGVAEVREGKAPDSALVKTFYDPFAADAVLKIFSTGIRNGYDLLWHTNGWLYVPANGPVGGGAVSDDPRTPQDERLDEVGRGPDLLLKIARGEYSGHPNPLRNEFIAHGGNPTDGPDPNEIVEYPVGTMPDPRYNPKHALDLGFHWSPNGVIEYRNPDAPSVLDGAIIFANYSRGDDLRAMTLDANGDVVADFNIPTPDGKIFTATDPLDLTLGAGGRIYVSTLERSNGSSKVYLLTPAARTTP